MRFFLSALLACILVTHAFAQLPYAIFEDVPASKPYYDQVNLLRERLVTQGCSVHPAQYCPDLPYALTRGQAAVLIIRSIYSARTGDPEGFTYPSTPYFTDVPADHEQFKYIQKMKELGITSGYTATTYEPWGTLNFGQIAVFSHRARQVRLWQPVSAPYPCSYAPFPDVPSDYPFCPYIRDMASELGNDKAISPNCWTGFCPESIPMSRGALAFYLANGVMNVGQPQWLPNGGGAVPGVWLPGPPEPDCSHGGFFAGNQIVVLGGQLYSWAQTFANSAANPEVWNLYTAMRLVASGAQLQFDEDHSSYGTIWSATQSYNFIINPNLNYRNDAWHSIASMCLANGNSWFTSVNNPVIFSLSTPVLYRGTAQSFVIRGSTLQQANSVRLQSVATSLPSAMTPSQYQVGVSVETPYNAPAGATTLYLHAVSPNDNATLSTNALPVTVADPSPIISSVVPSQWSIGTVTTFTVNGSGFGAAPNLVITGTGVLSYTISSRGPTHITGTVSITPAALPGSITLSVTSLGSMGTGFQAPPQGGQASAQTTVSTAPVTFTIQRNGLPISGSQSVLAGEPIQLTGVIASSGIPMSPSIQWQIGGVSVGGWDLIYSNPLLPTSANVLPISGLTSTQPCSVPTTCSYHLSFYWVNRGTSVPVVFQASLSGVSQLPATATFNIDKPVGNPNVQVASVTVGEYPTNICPQCSGENYLFFGRHTPPQVGIESSWVDPQGRGLYPAGTYYWIQMVNALLARRQDANTYQWERITLPEPSLDTKVPQSSGYTTNDSPGVRLPNGYQEVAVNASFSLWLMYRPFAANSIFVPVHRIDWHYGGRALLAGAVWSLDNPTYSNPPAIQPDPNYPEWTKNAANYITPQNWVVEQ